MIHIKSLVFNILATALGVIGLNLIRPSFHIAVSKNVFLDSFTG